MINVLFFDNKNNNLFYILIYIQLINKNNMYIFLKEKYINHEN